MGEVWRARDERLDREVAVKILHPWVADDPDLRDRLEREAKALARLSHPSVVRLYDAQHEGKRSFIVMELVEGSSLSSVLANGRVSWEEARRYLRPVAEALAYAHRRGVIHRDLSPANVLVDGDSGRIVVTDFGLARLATAGRHSTLGLLAGTPEYWAPEQALGSRTTAAADVYALGCILFSALSGRLPFEGEDRLASGLRRAHEDAPLLAEAAPGVPGEASTLVDSMLARDPDTRPSAAEAARALGSVGPLSPPTEAETKVRRPGAEPRTAVVAEAAPATIAVLRRAYRARSRRPLVLAAAALAALAAAAAGGVYLLAASDDSHLVAPALTGRSLAQARAVLEAAAEDVGLDAPAVQVAGSRYSESVLAGAVLSQEPPAGTRLEAPAPFRVRLSLGSAVAQVPSVSELPTRAAVAALRREGFTPVRRWAPSRTVPVGLAIETRPGAGKRVRRPAEVEVYESTGPPRVPVPDVRGADVEDAVSQLEAAGFTASVQERFAAGKAPGTVLDVSPEPGERTAYGSAIRLVVATAVDWTTLGSVQGTGARTEPVLVPPGGRVVLTVASGAVTARWSGDTAGEQQTAAGESDVLVGPEDVSRGISVTVEPVGGDAAWELRLEVPGESGEAAVGD